MKGVGGQGPRIAGRVAGGETMKAKDLMTRDVAACRPDEPMAAAARIMWEHDCGVVPVLDGQKVVGVVTDRDLCMAAFTRNRPLSGMAVRDAMAKRVFSCHEGDDEAKVHAAMREHQVRRLPVVDDEGRLLGIVSLNNLALRSAAAKGSAAEKGLREVARTLIDISRHREPATV
jgi:CBS domain-containing protein